MTTAPHPPRRALIVIDVQNEYVTGNLRIEHPPVDDSLTQIGRAIDAAHAAGVPVVVVQNDAAPTAPLFALGSDGHALHPVVATRRHDHLLHKTLPGAFTETGLAEWLAERDVDTLTVCGYMTHNCDASTIIDALHRGLAVEFLVDASGAVPYRNAAGFASAADIHRVFSVVLHSRFAAVVTTASWIDALRAGERLERSTIAVSHQAALLAAA
ncbi:MAG TPA: cysteine hydrolase family protein [Burkholderiaceae bacterium]|nr:cysteine hydrolase family protein [Burkholderiaceae bacterium]